MKEILKKIIFKIQPILSTISPSMKNWFVRIFYTTYYPTVNDLKLKKDVVQYINTSYYPTLYNTPPFHYKRLIKNFNFDDKGIPMMMYKGKPYYNPVQIIQYGLLEYGFYLSDNDSTRLNIAIRIADWLTEEQDKITGCWNYNFDYYIENIDYILKKPWHSAMCQGQAISLLCRLYHFTKNERYLKSACLALEPFKVNVKDGGLITFFCGVPFYEEYPTQPANLTLNGFIFCLFGLYDLYHTIGNEEALNLYTEGLATLVKLLPLYDDSITSYYNLTHITFPTAKSIHYIKYHILHVILLENIYSIYQNDTIKYYIEKWRRM